jgi:hypothetical protein
VLEWWRPVLRDPDLDWTLNHQAHLTADLATLASAGARLLDQIEPRAAEEAAEAAHARRVAQEKRWGPAAVPPFVPTNGPRPGAPGRRPQPPAEVFGDAVPGAGAGRRTPRFRPLGQSGRRPRRRRRGRVPAERTCRRAAAGPGPMLTRRLPAALPLTKAPAAIEHQGPAHVPAQARARSLPPRLPRSIRRRLRSPRRPRSPPSRATARSGPERPSAAAEPTRASATGPSGRTRRAPSRRPEVTREPVRLGAAPASRVRLRRRAAVPAPPPAVFPQGGLPPRSPLVPGPGFGGPPQQGRMLAPNAYRAAEHGVGPFGFVARRTTTSRTASSPPDSAATSVACSSRPASSSARSACCAGGRSTRSAARPRTTRPPGTPSTHGAGERSAHGRQAVSARRTRAPRHRPASPRLRPRRRADAAPPTTTTSGPDATTVSSVRVTLLGGSARSRRSPY